MSSDRKQTGLQETFCRGRVVKTICRGWMLFLAVAMIALCSCSSDERSANLDLKEEPDTAIDTSVEIQSASQPHSDEGNEIYLSLSYNKSRKTVHADPVAILDSSGFIDAMTEINKNGVVAFEDKYLKNKSIYFYDEKCNEFEMSNMSIREKEPGDPYVGWDIDGVLNDKNNKDLAPNSRFVGYDHPIKCESSKINDIISNPAFENIKTENNGMIDFQKKDHANAMDFDRDGLADVIAAGNIVNDKLKPPVLLIKYGDGRNSVHADFGQRIELLYNVTIIGFFDYDKDGYRDILIRGEYYESHYFAILKNNNGKPELAFRTTTRYID